ncbi:hypothetical protein BOVMAS18_14780 [Streptococcus uberis]
MIMTYKKRNKLVISLFLSIFILFPFYNLSSYSLYYSINSKYTQKNEIPGILLNHLSDIMTEQKKEYLGDYILQVDGTNSIIYKFSKEEEKTFNQESDNLSAFYYTKIKNGTEYLYNLNSNLKIRSIYGNGIEKYPINLGEQKTITKEIKNMVRPLLKKIDKPIVNLQWLYDLIYH